MAATSDKTVVRVGLRFDQSGASLNTDCNVILIDQDGKLYPFWEITPDVSNWAVVLMQPIMQDELLTEVAPNISNSATKSKP